MQDRLPIETQDKRQWIVAVRDLTAFPLRSGSLSRSAFRSVRRAREGTQGHVRLQGERPPHYRAEVPVSDAIETDWFVLRIQGRVDGVLRTRNGLLVEEIKTVVEGWLGEPDPLHWAQVKVYAHLLAREGTGDAVIETQLTYLNLDTDEMSVFRRDFSKAELKTFYGELVTCYVDWLTRYHAHLRRRDRALGEITFPYATKRAGQDRLMAQVSEAIAAGGTLLAEAPTGIGKTMSVLYPAVKALADVRYARVVYATARTTGQDAVRKAIEDLRAAGLKLRVLALASRDRLCFGGPDATPCDPAICPHARGYYDRYRLAVDEVMQGDGFWLDKTGLRALGERFQVCPAALAMDLLPWMDIVVADYNYLFDPQVRLAAFASNAGGKTMILIDEAHNLPDRARRMLSASLKESRLKRLGKELGKTLPGCRRALEMAAQAFRAAYQPEAGAAWMHLVQWPKGLRRSLGIFLQEADAWLTRSREAGFEATLLEVYWEVTTLLKLSEIGNRETHALLIEEVRGEQRSTLRLRWLCLDPAPYLEAARRETGPAVYFSATLAPLDYYRRLLGCGPAPRVLQLESPFPASNLCVSIHAGIATTYRKRGASYGRVADLIGPWVAGKRGNYWVFFSSYAYLAEVVRRFRASVGERSDLEVWEQSPEMSLDERRMFMERFDATGTVTRVGFAVLGGIFGEGVDLIGERLIGVAVVGVGLPQLCLENDLIKARFSLTHDGEVPERGFDFAYTYPGFNRVLQAVGRLQRTESDRGVVLLIGERYAHTRYRALYPPWWNPMEVRNERELMKRQRGFWLAAV